MWGLPRKSDCTAGKHYPWLVGGSCRGRLNCCVSKSSSESIRSLFCLTQVKQRKAERQRQKINSLDIRSMFPPATGTDDAVRMPAASARDKTGDGSDPPSAPKPAVAVKRVRAPKKPSCSEPCVSGTSLISLVSDQIDAVGAVPTGVQGPSATVVQQGRGEMTANRRKRSAAVKAPRAANISQASMDLEVVSGSGRPSKPRKEVRVESLVKSETPPQSINSKEAAERIDLGPVSDVATVGGPSPVRSADSARLKMLLGPPRTELCAAASSPKNASSEPVAQAATSSSFVSRSSEGTGRSHMNRLRLLLGGKRTAACGGPVDGDCHEAAESKPITE